MGIYDLHPVEIEEGKTVMMRKLPGHAYGSSLGRFSVSDLIFIRKNLEEILAGTHRKGEIVSLSDKPQDPEIRAEGLKSAAEELVRVEDELDKRHE